MKAFADRLMDAIDAKESPSCVGLDPRFSAMPRHIRSRCRKECGETFEGIAACFLEFNKAIIDAVKDEVAAVKPQMAFYEAYGHAGMSAFEKTVEHAKKRGLLVIEDAKRGDIGETAEAYSSGHLGAVDFWNGRKTSLDVDAITVNPYLGYDGIRPFVQDSARHGKGTFVLVKTSNPSSGELQDTPTILRHPALPELQKDLVVHGERTLKDLMGLRDVASLTILAPNYVRTAGLVSEWGADCLGERGYSSIGAVVGATYPAEASTLRRLMPSAYFLVPGYGAQGGKGADVVSCFNADGYGAVVSSSRGIAFAYLDQWARKRYSEDEFDEAAREAALTMKEDIVESMQASGRYPW